MLSVEDCRKYLGNTSLSDKQVEEFRDAIFALVENMVDEYISSGVTIEPICKKQSSTVESHLSDKKQKVTA
jgi:hypothetical protein